MAKKKRKRRKSSRAGNAADASVAKVAKDAKRTRPASTKPKPRLRAKTKDVETPSERQTHSAPPTKKSALPPELAHDDREIDSKSIVRFGGTVLLTTFAAMILAWFINSALVDSEHAGHELPPPMASSLPTAPAAPKLQHATQRAFSWARAGASGRPGKRSLRCVLARKSSLKPTAGWTKKPASFGCPSIARWRCW